MEENINLALAFIFKWVASLGLVGGFSYWLFKHLGSKWLDSKFEAKSINLKNKHDVLLADLKAAQDRSLRHVQSYIDREIHRAKKLADREFDVLKEGWTLLIKAFDAAQTTGTEWVTQLHRLTQSEIDRVLAREGMEQWEVDKVLSLQGAPRTRYFRRYQGYKRFDSYGELRRQLAAYLVINGIFMPPGMKERFETLEKMVATSIFEFKARLDTNEGAPIPPGFDQFAALQKLNTEGVQLRNELEAEIRGRIWSAARAAETSDAFSPDSSSASLPPSTRH